MKLLYSFFGICATVLMCASCTTDTTEELDLGNGYVTLTLTTGSATRADSSASEATEDKIDRVDLFIFPGTDAAAGAQPKYVTLTPDANGSTDISFRFEMEEFDKYFPNKASGSCELYVFVNLTEDDITALKAKNKGQYGDYVVAASDFKSKDAPANFVMTSGKQTLNYNATSQTFTVNDGTDTTIKVTRLAAKIRMAVKMGYVYTDAEGAALTPPTKPSDDASEDEKAAYATAFTKFKNSVSHTIIPSVYNDGKPSDMLLFIQDGVYKGQLDGTPLEGRTYYEVKVGDDNDKQYARVLAKPGTDDREAPEGYDFYNKLPYYSYPNEWENISSEEHNTMLTLQVKWEEHSGYIAEGVQPSGNDDVKPFDTWYSIPVNYNGNKLEANHYYRIKLHVTAVGSQNQHEPMELGNAECEILDWAQSADINVSVKDSRFLIVEKENWDMGTDESIEIPYVTSHNAIFRAINPPTYTVKVTYSNANEPSTKITAISTNISDSGRVPYWGSGTITMETSSTAGEHTYKDSQNTNTFEQNGYQIYTYELKDGNIIFTHKMRGLDPMGGDGTIDGAAYFSENGKEDGNSYSIEIKIMHEDMKGNNNLTDSGETLEDYWTRNIFITQSNTPVIVSTINRNIGGSGSSFTVGGSYGFWNSYVNINGVSQVPQIYTDATSLNNHLRDTFGGLGLPYSVLGEKTTEAEKAKITRDLYVLKVSSIAEDGKTVDVSYENNMTSPDNPNALTERDNIEKQRLATVAASTETKKVGSKTYNIGDPRSHNVNNKLGVDNSNDALDTNTTDGTVWNTPSMKTGYRTDNWPSMGTLKYYYPTKEDGSVTNMVAPKFIVSSSFGEVTTKILRPTNESYYESEGIDRTTARRRCSAYQELLYPAGRWRLPTKAEMELVAYMYSAGTIMMTFEPNKNYWTADGLYTVDTEGNAIAASGNLGLVRCVYDDWYWTDKVNSYRPDWTTINFMWGDRVIER